MPLGANRSASCESTPGRVARNLTIVSPFATAGSIQGLPERPAWHPRASRESSDELVHWQTKLPRLSDPIRRAFFVGHGCAVMVLRSRVSPVSRDRFFLPRPAVYRTMKPLQHANSSFLSSLRRRQNLATLLAVCCWAFWSAPAAQAQFPEETTVDSEGFLGITYQARNDLEVSGVPSSTRAT